MPCSASNPAPSRPDGLELRGRTACVRLPGRLLLAPMEGITEPVFRGLVAAEGGLAGACTEFLRISVAPVPRRIAARHLGPPVAGLPVAVQLMAAAPEHVARSAANAEAAGAAWIDLNFGCPAPVVFGKCAGSAMLGRPEVMAAVVREAIAGTGLPVTAKIRAGIDSPAVLADNCRALIAAGAAAVIVHGRLRTEGYHRPATWSWIAQAVAVAGSVPVIGNGGVEEPADVAALFAASGCSGVMIGRAALADPFIFRVAAGGVAPTRAEAAAFPRRYHDAAAEAYGPRTALAKLKQQVRWYRAGGLFAGREDERTALLRCGEAQPILAWFAAAA